MFEFFPAFPRLTGIWYYSLLIINLFECNSYLLIKSSPTDLCFYYSDAKLLHQLAPDPILVWPPHSRFDPVLRGVVVTFQYHPLHLDPRLVVSIDALVLQSTHPLLADAWMPFEPAPMRARTPNLPTSSLPSRIPLRTSLSAAGRLFGLLRRERVVAPRTKEEEETSWPGLPEDTPCPSESLLAARCLSRFT